jgi:polyribonucleotide 5'-hydroxyl-kinase
MTEGMAEIFGCELMLDKEYRFSGQKLAVFSWQGCTIELSEISLIRKPTIHFYSQIQ